MPYAHDLFDYFCLISFHNLYNNYNIFLQDKEAQTSATKRRKNNPCDEIKEIEVEFYKERRCMSSIVDEYHKFSRSDFDLENYECGTGNKQFDILKFWEDCSKIYPKLAAVARFILACPASSAPSERSFSQAGWTVNLRRTRLAPRNVNALLCIKSFMKGGAWKSLEPTDVDEED